jgi:hypothetical protein
MLGYASNVFFRDEKPIIFTIIRFVSKY